MRGKVVVEDEENYNKWIAKLETFSSFTAKRESDNLNNKKLVKINDLLIKEKNILRKKNVR
jgi:heme/copper-type cytochrome/quinol oxidase subunit 2